MMTCCISQVTSCQESGDHDVSGSSEPSTDKSHLDLSSVIMVSLVAGTSLFIVNTVILGRLTLNIDKICRTEVLHQIIWGAIKKSTFYGTEYELRPTSLVMGLYRYIRIS